MQGRLECLLGKFGLVGADTGQPLNWWWKRPHTCLARWNLHVAADWDVAGWTIQISVGTLAQGGWYVDHGGFGCRGFPDKASAWAAIRPCCGGRGNERRREVTGVSLPYVSFRYSYTFLADGAVVTSRPDTGPPTPTPMTQA